MGVYKLDLYECPDCGRDTLHEDGVCVACGSECCFPEDGKLCRHCYEVRAAFLEDEV